MRALLPLHPSTPHRLRRTKDEDEGGGKGKGARAVSLMQMKKSFLTCASLNWNN